MKITLAIPKGKQYKKRLDQELSLAENIKSKQTRDQVKKGLAHLIRFFQDGHVFLYDGDKDICWDYEYPLNDFIYFCGKEFVVPNITLGGSYMLITMDANEATIGVLKGNSIKNLWTETSNVPRKHNKGGQSKARFQRGREEALKQWYKKVANKIKEFSV
jgi:peptide chain release factor subunit 1